MGPEWTVGIFTAIAHLHLVLLFLPSYWRPIEAEGAGWMTLVTPIGLPLWCMAMLLPAAMGRGVEAPFLFVAGLGLGAASATLALVLVRLRRLRAEGGDAGDAG